MCGFFIYNTAIDLFCYRNYLAKATVHLETAIFSTKNFWIHGLPTHCSQHKVEPMWGTERRKA